MTIATTLFLSLFITLSLIPIFKKFAIRANILDMPNERKVHTQPVPRVGGLAIALGFIIPVLLWLPMERSLIAILLGAGILIIAGCVDDMHELGYRMKLLAQIAAALIVVIYGEIRIESLGALLPEGVRLPLAVSIPLSVIVITGITNAINLADGLDGLAGGISLIMFLCLFALAFRASDAMTMFLCISMLGAIFAFLTFNTHPATVFMGDTGSQLLGFMAIVLSMRLTLGNSPLSPVMPLFIIGVPIIDTGTVMLERIASGQSPFVADKKHIHHKLLKIGFFHTEAVFIIYVVQMVFVLCAYILRFHNEWILLGLYCALSGAIVGFFVLTGRTSFTLNRSGFLDLVIKKKLKTLKNQTFVLHIASLILTYLLPMLLFSNVILIKNLPPWIAHLAMASTGLILFLWVIHFRFVDKILRTVLFFAIPAILFFSQDMVTGRGLQPANFAVLTICLLATVVMIRYDRRQASFKASPMDFLILILILFVPFLLEPFLPPLKTEVLLAQTILFQYCFQIVCNGRSRARLQIMTITTGALIMLIFKGFIP